VKLIGDVTRSSRTRLDKRTVERLLSELERIGFSSRGDSALKKLCAAGVEYAWRELERTTDKKLFELISAKAQLSLRRHLQQTLEQITGPSL